MANSYPNVVIAGLPATQTAWTMPTGETVIVDIRQIGVPDAVANLTSEAHLAVQATVWKANANGTPALDTAGRKVGPPTKNHTILMSAIAEKSVDLASELTTVLTDALDRAAQWFAVYPMMQTLAANSKAAPVI